MIDRGTPYWVVIALAVMGFAAVELRAAESAGVKAEHSMIGVTSDATATSHTQHPDAQWYPDAAFGLFLHWSPSSVRAMNISWPMIPGRALAAKKIDDPTERERIVREGDWNLNGKPQEITPNQYWALADQFNPQDYDPDRWLKAAKEAGFSYAVLTTRHHDGYAMWPSKFGDFGTATHMGGRDLVKPYVDACRKAGLKVGLYYSPPNWHFDREYMNFLYHGAIKTNEWVPSLDPDLKIRATQPSKEQVKQHQAEYAAMVKGQVEELLTNYGKIDLLWFDGKPPIPNGDEVITAEEIRKLQPGIVINPRLHGKGDFVTYERKLSTDKVAKSWAEFCNTWNSNWSYTRTPYKANGYVLGQLAKCRSLGVNYLLGIGPMASGTLAPEAYENMAAVAQWMKTNSPAIHGAKPLPSNESANIPATAAGSKRFLFAMPQFKDGKTSEDQIIPPTDMTVTIKGAGTPISAKLLGDGAAMKYATAADGTVTIELPAANRTKLVDVVEVDFASPAAAAGQ